MVFSFRIRVNRAPYVTINTDETRHDFLIDDPTKSLSLRASDGPDKSLREAQRWVLVGEGYSSEHEAKEAGSLYAEIFLVALSKAKLGVDFGDDAGKSVITEAGLAHFSKEFGTRVLQDSIGLSVFEATPPPRFLDLAFSGLLQRDAGRAFEELSVVLKSGKRLSPNEKLSHSLFHASMFQVSASVRFLLLVMSMEALIQPLPKSKAAIALIDELDEKITVAELDDREKRSLKGSLLHLRQESIGRAAKRMADERLTGKLYDGVSPGKFISDAYSLRSKLVHGSLPRPSFEIISSMVGGLEMLISDLLDF